MSDLAKLDALADLVRALDSDEPTRLYGNQHGHWVKGKAAEICHALAVLKDREPEDVLAEVVNEYAERVLKDRS